jgi:glycosyltransferase involved in cell wall biosynthesis
MHIGLVTPWYGTELTGGAERTAWQVATGLAERGHLLEVFTTCARAFADDWGTNARPSGTGVERGVTVHRFPVDPRDPERFDRANAILLGRPASYYREQRASRERDVADDFVQCGIRSSAAIAALHEAADGFDAVLVLPYPYGLCLDAVDALGRRAILQPCLHDEPYAYLPAIERAIRRAGLLVFNARGERVLAERLFGPAVALTSAVVGQWVDEAPPARAVERIGSFRPRDHRYVLYLGRRDATKNVDLLVESFAMFRRNERIATLELVLIGPGRQSFADPRHGIVDLGKVDEAQKAALLAHAWAIAQPSVNESFSRALMEGWREGKPVLVNSRCAATAEAVRAVDGGWTASTKAEWSTALAALDRLPPAERDRTGARGRAYVDEETDRERILDRYEAAIRSVRAPRRPSPFTVAPAAAMLRAFDERACRTIMYAGPLDATAALGDLLSGFAHALSFGIDARLVLVGAFDPQTANVFAQAVRAARLGDRVVAVDDTSPEVATACYRSADLFWSFADEGPSQLVDALGFGVPIIAFANPRARAVLGPSGLLMRARDDHRTLAGVATLLLRDTALRDVLLAGQRRRFATLHEIGELERTA